MTPRSKKDLDELKLQRRQLIIETALQLFSEYSFRGTSIDEIAKKAGISKGSVYTYFESKDELLHSIFKFYLNRIPTFFHTNELYDEPNKVIREAYGTLISNFESEPDLWSQYFVLSFQFMLDQSIKNRYLNQKENTIDGLKRLLIALHVPNPDTETFKFMALFEGAVLNFIYQHDFPIREVIMGQVEFYCSFYA
jgi:AcrR family transcriptional regulator